MGAGVAAIVLSHSSCNDGLARTLEKWLRDKGFDDLFEAAAENEAAVCLCAARAAMCVDFKPQPSSAPSADE